MDVRLAASKTRRRAAREGGRTPGVHQRIAPAHLTANPAAGRAFGKLGVVRGADEGDVVQHSEQH
jgi:hypothetical protein